MNTVEVTTEIKAVKIEPITYPTFFTGKNHSHFFIENNELWEMLTNGKKRHRIHLQFKTAAEKYLDAAMLTQEQITAIERKYLKSRP